MDSEQLSRSGSSWACSLRHVSAARHRVLQCIRSAGAAETSKAIAYARAEPESEHNAHDHSMRTPQ